MKNNNKTQLANIFREISQLESNRFKSNAYLHAAITLDNMGQEEFEKRKTFLNIQGVGLSINSKILDFRDKGLIPPKLNELRETNCTFLDVQLYKIRKGLVTKRIPYDQATELANEIMAIMRSLNIEGIFLGSYRRHKPFIADLDLLLHSQEDYNLLVNKLRELGYKQMVSGDAKTSFVFNNSEKTTLDITWCNKESWAFSVLHFTGSAAFNINMRAEANRQGYTLNQYGIRSLGSKGINLEINTEEGIFDFLGMEYVEPENR